MPCRVRSYAKIPWQKLAWRNRKSSAAGKNEYWKEKRENTKWTSFKIRLNIFENINMF